MKPIPAIPDSLHSDDVSTLDRVKRSQASVHGLVAVREIVSATFNQPPSARVMEVGIDVMEPPTWKRHALVYR
jgi:hypothetical protein